MVYRRRAKSYYEFLYAAVCIRAIPLNMERPLLSYNFAQNTAIIYGKLKYIQYSINFRSIRYTHGSYTLRKGITLRTFP